MLNLRVRLTLWYGLLIAATLTLFSLVVYIALARTLHRALDVSLETEARDQLASTDLPISRRSEDHPPPGLIVALFDAAGQLQYLSSAGAPAVAPQGQHFYSRNHWRYCEAPVRSGGTVQVLCSEEGLERALHELALVLILAVPLTALGTGAGGLFLASRALRPIDEVTRTAAALGAADLSRRLDAAPYDDEVGRLVTTFNAMLGRLESAFERQRQLTSDAAHELRTPLTLMLGRSELALSRPREAEEYKATLSEIHTETERLTRMVARMLTLARSDAGALEIERERLSLFDLACDAAAALEPMAQSRGVQLTLEGNARSVVLGDQTRLVEMTVNLLENALQATPAGGSVVLRVSRDALEVSDTGCGIAPEHQQRIFERFYRIDGARTGSSTGLGLAICRAIAEHHGGGITVRSQPGAGSTFRVTLPSA